MTELYNVESISERGVYALCQRGGNESVEEYWTKGGVTTDWKCLIAACLISEGSVSNVGLESITTKTLSRTIERCSTDRAEEIKEPGDVEKCSSLRAV
ncbi:hypothetical protein RIR_jg10553.t1 [Rhizophagus irregularis DAOM 181602=DAOM 197198]|nr:hypothetical protein RIR_jg10553.t1 [Rhizophagus irregularis DAOM 181602=DAOM 197198]